jgi:hypothetical protein
MRKLITAQSSAAVSQVWMSQSLSEALKRLTVDERAALLVPTAGTAGYSTQAARIKLLRYFQNS